MPKRPKYTNLELQKIGWFMGIALFVGLLAAVAGFFFGGNTYWERDYWRPKTEGGALIYAAFTAIYAGGASAILTFAGLIWLEGWRQRRRSADLRK